MKKGIVILYFICVSLYCRAQASKDIQWISFEQLSDSLEVNPKKVLLYFHTDWCSFCKKMSTETFKNQDIIDKINEKYYAVALDAETVDTIYFEKTAYTNSSTVKTTNQFHTLAKVFFNPPDKPVFPITVILSENFSILHRESRYLSIKTLSKIL